MAFDIYELDKLDEFDEEAGEKYRDAVMERFLTSPEGQERAEADPELGFWAYQFMYYGYNYLGVTLPQMSLADAREVVAELFPRKISTFSPDDADDAIPELIAFWKYLQREYNFSNARAILKFLAEIKPKFTDLMNDPANFGIAKSFFMQGQAMGFDMATEEGINNFMAAYNATLLSGEAEPLPLPPLADDLFGPPARHSPSYASRKDRVKKKRLRKMVKASRQKNKKKKRK